jgi:hypothetical protein
MDQENLLRSIVFQEGQFQHMETRFCLDLIAEQR